MVKVKFESRVLKPMAADIFQLPSGTCDLRKIAEVQDQIDEIMKKFNIGRYSNWRSSQSDERLITVALYMIKISGEKRTCSNKKCPFYDEEVNDLDTKFCKECGSEVKTRDRIDKRIEKAFGDMVGSFEVQIAIEEVEPGSALVVLFKAISPE